MSRRPLLLLCALLLAAGCTTPPPSPTPSPTPTPTPTPAPTPTPPPATLSPVGRLIVTSEQLPPARTQLNLLLPTENLPPQLIGDGSRLYFTAASTPPLSKEGSSRGSTYALYLYDPADATVRRVVGTVTPRELGRPKEVATQTGTDAAGLPTWSIVYAGGVCYRANGSYTNKKTTNAYLYAYDRQLSVEATEGERGRCIFGEYPLNAVALRPWVEGSAPARLCPADRPDCGEELGSVGHLVLGPIDPRAPTDATLPLPPVTLFTTVHTAADGTVRVDTLRFLKSNGTSGEVRYGGAPLDGTTSLVISAPDGLLYLIVRGYGDTANHWFLARLDPADPRTVTPLTTPPTR